MILALSIQFPPKFLINTLKKRVLPACQLKANFAFEEWKAGSTKINPKD